MNHKSAPAIEPSLAPWLLLWTLFIVYGSLVPLDFQPLDWHEALERFRQAPMYDLGVDRRADWVANGLLYVPFGLLTTGWLAGADPSLWRRCAAALGALVFGTVLSVTVEFTQVHFPGRTVSRNDMLANFIGTTVGILIGWRWTALWRQLVAAAAGAARLSTSQWLHAYRAAFLVLTLFPYDLLVSAGELAAKLAGNQWGWWLADAGDSRVFKRVVFMSAEALTMLPLGWLWARRAGRASAGIAAAAGVGLLWGLAIEIAQFFIASGISQGASVLTRAAGFVLAAALWSHRAGWTLERFRGIVSRHAALLALLYVAAALAASGWFTGPWRTTDAALARLSAGEVRFVPFYYHYFTSEASALISLVLVALLYTPVGLLVWSRRGSGQQAALCAFALAALVEAGKLFPDGMRPDPTNLWIAMGGAGLAAGLLGRVTAMGATVAPTHAGAPGGAAGLRLMHAGLAIAGALAAGWLAGFPFATAALGTLLIACMALVWWRPVWLFALVPAALPMLDLAPWSGRTLIDEFDLLLLLGLAAGFARVPSVRAAAVPDRALGAALALVGLAVALGAARMLLPWPGVAGEAFSSPLSPLNALRIGKGALWALLLYGLARRLAATGRDVRPAFGVGMVVGLAGTVAVIVWERVAFAGLFDFGDPYRVSGPFYAMHTGGAYVEAFIVMALPFAAAWLLGARAWLARLAALALLAGAVYALAVTFSRGGYAAGALVVLVMAVLAARTGARRRGSLTWAALLVVASVAVAYPILSGPVASGRLAESERDLGVRRAHWTEVWRLRDSGLKTMWLGMGLGSYPAARYWGSPEDRRPAVHRFETGGQGGQGGRLRLGPGQGLYVDQIVSVPSGLPLQLEVRAGSGGSAGRLQVSLCQKWLLTSFECVDHVFELGPGQPPVLSAVLDSAPLSGDGGPFARPLKFSLSNGGATVLDVEDVSLATPEGGELLRNGDFGAGADRWSFTADDHLAWHVKTLPLALMFELGLLGTLAMTALLGLALLRSLRAAWSGSSAAGALAAALLGFLAVAVFDTVIDTPRFLMLVLLCGWLAAIGSPPTRERRGSPSRADPRAQASRDTIRG